MSIAVALFSGLTDELSGQRVGHKWRLIEARKCCAEV